MGRSLRSRCASSSSSSAISSGCAPPAVAARSTTDLQIEVTVEQGVVYLRGRVEGIEDVDNAESVAGRVPGVLDVVEELDVIEL